MKKREAFHRLNDQRAAFWRVANDNETEKEEEGVRGEGGRNNYRKNI